MNEKLRVDILTVPFEVIFVTLTIKFKCSLTTNGGLSGGLNGGLSGGLNGGLKLTERKAQVVERLREVPEQTIEEVALALDISKRTLERTFSALKQKGIIEKVGSKKTGVWRIYTNF